MGIDLGINVSFVNRWAKDSHRKRRLKMWKVKRDGHENIAPLEMGRDKG